MRVLIIFATASMAFALANTDDMFKDASMALDERGSSSGVEICKTCKPGSTLTCCQATFAGDLSSVQFLSNLAGFKLDPRDVSCLGVRMDSFSNPSNCVGVKTCCDVVIPNIFTKGLGQPLAGTVNSIVSILGIGLGISCQGINQSASEYGQCGNYYH